MAIEPSELLHTIVIVDVKDETTRKRISHTLSRVTKNVPEEQIRARMSKLPWTLTRSATTKKTVRIVKLLERLGAVVDVVPPLPEEVKLDTGDTQFIPESQIFSETQPTDSRAEESEPTYPPDSESTTASPSVGTSPAPQVPSDRPERDMYALQPLSLGGILDRSFTICRTQFWKLVSIAAIPYLILVAAILVVIVVFGVAGFTAYGLGTASKGVFILLAVLLIPSTIVFVTTVFYIGQGAMIHAVSATYLGEEVLVLKSYRFVMSRLARYLLTLLLFGLAVFGSVVAVVGFGTAFFFLFQELTSSGWWAALTWLPLSLIPMYAIMKLLLFDKVVLIEDMAYVKALKKSWSLISGKAEGNWPRGYFLRLLILLHLFALIYFTIWMLFQFPATMIQILLPQRMLIVTILGQVLSNAGGIIAGLFFSVCLVVFYYDIRIRKEGFDLRMLSRMTGGTQD